MSQYTNIIPPEQPLPLPSSYYRSDDVDAADSSPLPMAVPPTQGSHHQNANVWSQYYTESTLLLPPPPSIPSYIPEAGPSRSTAPYVSAITAPLTPVTSVISPSGFPEITHANSNQVEYPAQTPTQPLPFSEYATISQRTIASSSSPRQLTTFPALYTFGHSRQGSPSSHTSISDYGTGTKGWESPGLNALEEMRYTPSHAGVVDVDGSSERATEAGSRHSSVPASTTTSSSSSQPSVKVEPQDPDDCFVMELTSFSPTSPVIGHSSASRQSSLNRRNVLSRRNLLSQSLAPRAEVPLRATGASEEMRCMMGVFRLNPFAMHSLSNMTDSDKEGLKELEAYCGEGQPLEEEPVMFEFQLEIVGLSTEEQEQADDSDGMLDSETRRPPGLEPEEEYQLRSFSPSFELYPDDIDSDRNSARQVHFMSDIAIQGQNQELNQAHDQENDRQGEPWIEKDSASASDAGTSSTPSRSTYSPLHGSPHSIASAVQTQANSSHHHDQTYPLSTASVWDAVNEQYQDVEQGQRSSAVNRSQLPTMGNPPFVYGHASFKAPRLHTATSHPYLRKSLQNQHALQTHGQSFSLSAVQGYSQDSTPSPQPGPSYIHPMAHRPRQSHQMIAQQSPIHPLHPHNNEEYEQQHPPPYSYPVQAPIDVVGDVQHLAGPVSASYMRPTGVMRAQGLGYETHTHVYSPRSPNGSVGGYTQSPYTSQTSPPMIVHSSQQNMAPRRWSLPDTGGGHGHGPGIGGPFLGNV